MVDEHYQACFLTLSMQHKSHDLTAMAALPHYGPGLGVVLLEVILRYPEPITGY